MNKIGLFLNGELIIEYPNEPDCYVEAVDDCKEAIEKTGMFYELKLFED